MPNRLIHEKSPYLLQHAHNPVDWYPWGDEAFTKAQSEGRPIFLSIGYSTCHWCHVMESESFESPETAEIMNRYFVNIKVDREERPDVDRVYMNALHAMGEQGGWPMSVFLTPDRRPFFGGTYFPPVTRYGRIGFPDLLRRIHALWTESRPEVEESASGLTDHLRTAVAGPPADLPGPGAFDHAFAQLARTYDRVSGGFGGAPKFPRPPVFTFLLRYAARTGNSEALAMTADSLRQMALGGVYDHIGGGFHRYSVDGAWRVPHFEKMLYDQAQLLDLFVDTWRLTRDRFFSDVAAGVAAYVLRDLTLPEGGFCSAEDADSESPDHPGRHAEGAFYLWTLDELASVLGESAARVFASAYGVEPEGNAAVDPHQEFRGRNILYRARTDEEVAALTGEQVDRVAALLRSSRSALSAARNRRPRPSRDDKMIASWNGMMIGALARAGGALEEPGLTTAAVRAAEMVDRRLYESGNAQLFRRFRDGETRHPAHLEDYACVAGGFLDLYESTSDLRWLRRSVELSTSMIRRFAADGDDGLFDTAGDDPTILVRTREQYDGAEPSGNATAAMTLLRLADHTGRGDFRERAEGILRVSSGLLSEHPHVMPYMLSALSFHLGLHREVVIAGRKGEAAAEELLRVVRQAYLPDSVVILAEPGDEELARFSSFAASLARQSDGPRAYVCERQTCRMPTRDPVELARMLEAQLPRPASG